MRRVCQVSLTSSGPQSVSTRRSALPVSLPCPCLGQSPSPVHRRRSERVNSAVAFDPTSRWLAEVHDGEIDLLPVANPNPHVLHGTGSEGQTVAFTPDGESLAAAGQGGMRIWNLDRILTRVLGRSALPGSHWMVLDPLGRFVTLATPFKIVLVSLDDGCVRGLTRVGTLRKAPNAPGVFPR